MAKKNKKEKRQRKGKEVIDLTSCILANADLSKAGELGIVSAYNVIKRYCKEN